MCSWCWGFMPVIERVRNDYDQRLKVELLLGGLRPGTEHPLPAAQRQQIIGHWHAVHRLTGQPFRFERAMPDGFIYDTEPASRAVVAVSKLSPDATFAFFRAIQSAFYVEQRNVTQASVLSELAVHVGLEAQTFLDAFESQVGPGYYAKSFSQGASVGRAWFSHVDRAAGGFLCADFQRLLLFRGIKSKNPAVVGCVAPVRRKLAVNIIIKNPSFSAEPCMISA